MLKRLKKSINTTLLFIRAFEIACLVVKRKKKEKPRQKEKEKEKKEEASVMGTSRTVIGESVEIPVRTRRVEDEIDYEAESIPLETREISFESLEMIDNVVSGNEEVTDESKEALKSLDGTELGFQIRTRITSLLDKAELPSPDTEERKTKLADLSALFD